MKEKLPNGHVRDAVVYSIIASEWPVVKARLLEKLELYKEKAIIRVLKGILFVIHKKYTFFL